MRKTTMFRELLAKEKTVVTPAAIDCLSARIIENLGFKAISLSGFCLAATRMGIPDIGLEGRTLAVDYARSIAASVDVPVRIDAGTGYDGPLGVYLTVKELIRAGIAGCSIEDQTSPPVCPFIGAPEVISIDQFSLKIKAAIEARRDEHDEDFVITARTDAAKTLGIEEAIKRGRAYREAGADLIFLGAGAPHDKEGLRRVIHEIGAPFSTLYFFDRGLRIKDYEEIGVKLLAGIEALWAAAKVWNDIFLELKNTGFIKEEYCHMPVSSPGVIKTLKVEKWIDLAKKYQGSPR